MRRQLWQLILIQFKDFFREPGALFWSFAFPILMSYGLGIAFSNKEKVVRTVALVENTASTSVLDTFLMQHAERLSNSPKSEIQYEKTIKNDKLGYTSYRFLISNFDNALVLLKRGNISLIITEVGDSIRFHFDPNNPEAQLTYLHLNAMIHDQSILEESENITVLSAAGTRYIDFLIPGLITMGIMSSCLWGISYGLIEKRSKKLLRRMVATPMKKSYFLIAQFISRLILTLFETLVLIIFSKITFDLEIQGSIPALALVFLSGNFVFIGIGILIASRTANTQVGNGLISAVTMPMMVLSGIFFSYQNFPDWIVPIIQKMPLTMFTDSVRSIFIEGAGIAQVALNISMMTIIGLVTFISGLKIFKWY